jgi:outer membrane protein OmpA-like peptidoglycan-associated protein
MIKQLSLAFTGVLLLGSTAGAADADPRRNREEAVGLGAGAAIGALGGPLGAVFGAMLGGYLGNVVHDERGARMASEQRWAEARAEADALDRRLAGREREVATLTSARRHDADAYRSMLEQAFDLQVLFHTGDSALPESADERLGRLAALLGGVEGVAVRIEGHADGRGDAVYNEQLSAARAAAVRDALIQGGVPAERITVSAEGERYAGAAEDDLDALALERRVRLTVTTGSGDRVARQ